MIRGFFNLASGLPVPWIRVLLFLPGLSQSWAPVNLLIDTGCTVTTLHPHDASYRMGIDESRLRRPELWPRTRQMIGIGGSTNDFPMSARYSFDDESGEREIIEGQILVAQLTPATERLPSLLGWDVLRDFELTTNLRDERVTLRGLR